MTMGLRVISSESLRGKKWQKEEKQSPCFLSDFQITTTLCNIARRSLMEGLTVREKFNKSRKLLAGNFFAWILLLLWLYLQLDLFLIVDIFEWFLAKCLFFVSIEGILLHFCQSPLHLNSQTKILKCTFLLHVLSWSIHRTSFYIVYAQIRKFDMT